MNKELQQKLYDRFPALYRQKDLPMTQTCMCWGIEPDEGWFDLIWMLSLALEEEAKASGSVIEAVQVKEKFGGLRFYTNACTDRAHNLISAAERLSEATCEVCGKWGKVTNRGNWLKCVCETHAKELGYAWEAPITKRMMAAVDVLKAAIADRLAMVTIENKYGRGVDGTEDEKRKKLAELALDVLTGEQAI